MRDQISTPGGIVSPQVIDQDFDPKTIVFVGGGELGTRCIALDWHATALGSIGDWSPALRTAAGLVVNAGFPTVLLWGDELIQIYNDGYRLLMGRKHPDGLGQPTRDCWPEVWHLNAPIYARVRAGETVSLEDALFPITRHGALEDAYFTLAYSPVRDERGAVAGVLVQVHETTAAVVALTLQRQRDAFAADAASAEHRAARVLERMSDGFLAFDCDFRFVTVNGASERVLGMSRDRLLGRTLWEVFPGVADTDVGRAYRRVVSESVEQHVVQHYTAEGYDLHLDVHAYPTDDGGVAVFWRDISAQIAADDFQREFSAHMATWNERLSTDATERERLIAALAESERRFRTVQEITPSGFAVMRPLREGDRADGPVSDFEFSYVNASGARLLRADPGSIVGARLLARFPGAAHSLFAHYAHVADTGVPYHEEVRYAADGLDLGLALTAVRVGADVALTFTDVTERMRAKAELDTLAHTLVLERARLGDVFEHAPSFLAVMRGADHVFELANDAYRQLVGGRQLIGLPLLVALPELGTQGFAPLMDDVLATGVPYVGREVPIALFNGATGVAEERYLDFIYQPLTEADGTRSGVVAHGSDVTAQVLARRETERLLAVSERARADASAANRAKGDFLGVMSHELRTPLNAIGGYAELMEMGIRGPVTAEQREDLRRIQKSQRYLLGLINEVLKFTKLETGTVRFDLEDVPVCEAFGTTEVLVAPQIREKGIALEFAGCAPTLAVRADRDKLHQALVNLLSNATKFTSSGGRIDIGCDDFTTPDGRGWVRLMVRDSGIGIPADKLEAIFDPFVQVHPARTRPEIGVGLGLAISRDLARGMGGDLTVESTFGDGSTFSLTLPRV